MIEGDRMATFDEEMSKVEGDVDALSADETRELADLQALEDHGQESDPDQEARFEALDAKVTADTAAIDAADAPAAPPAV
jgi:hypothetical protein